mgnify:CR=1 FL=1
MSLLLHSCDECERFHLQADKFKVSGIVKDATGEPVIGASVVEKGTTNGTVTDLDGNFNLTVASNSTVVISFIGYSDQEFRISKDNMVLNVNLKEGYGND